MPANRQHIFLPWTVQEREDPVVEFAGAEGVYFHDRQGRRYLDFLSQLFNCNLGHGNRRVIEAIRSQAQQACCVSPQLLTAERSLLSEELTSLVPGDLDKCMFVNSGSEGNELAFIMARMVTGRPKIFAKYRSYHGTTFNTLGTAGDPRRVAVEPGPPGAVRFFDPYCYRCDFGLTYPDCGIHCLQALERQIELENPETVAAVVVEPFTGAAGGFPLPEGYLPGLRDLCDRHGILLIADEVITGFGRTGAWFGVDHDSVVPDLMVLAKGITSGYVPMGAVVVRRHISRHFETRMLPIGGTYAASPLATAAARACLIAYREEGCIDNAHRMGRLLMTQLRELKEKHPCIGDIRRQGSAGLRRTGERPGFAATAQSARCGCTAPQPHSPPGLGGGVAPAGSWKSTDDRSASDRHCRTDPGRCGEVESCPFLVGSGSPPGAGPAGGSCEPPPPCLPLDPSLPSSHRDQVPAPLDGAAAGDPGGPCNDSAGSGRTRRPGCPDRPRRNLHRRDRPGRHFLEALQRGIPGPLP